MKKIGKKLSNFTKLFLAFSLLFNSVSSFAVVLAETIPEDGVANVENNGEVSDKENTTENRDSLIIPIDYILNLIITFFKYLINIFM